MAERAGFHAMALGTPGLGCVFDQLEIVFLGKAGKGIPGGALAVEVNGEDGAYVGAARVLEDFLDGCRVEIEGDGVDIGEDGGGSGAEDGADRGEKAEGGGEDGRTRGNFCGSEGQPQRVGPG